MSTPSRESVYKALFALVTPLGPSGGKVFKTVSREAIEVQRVPPGDQPVLFMDEAFESNAFSGTGLIKKTWTVYFHIGATSAKGAPASAVLNPLIDAVEAALTQTGDEEQTLGGLVTRVNLNGQSVKNLGNNSLNPEHRQAVCYLPVDITLPVS